MIRHTWLLVVLAGCPQHAKAPVDTLGSTHIDHDPRISFAPPRTDAHQPFRKTFQDPGGMWLPSQLLLPKHVDILKSMGVELDPRQLANPLADPLGAVVQLPGCTGSFVSADGLIVTNHHCAQSALQANSTPDQNLVVTGFTAKTLADEKPAGPAQRVLVVQAYRDVTTQIRDGLETIRDGAARKAEVEKREKKLIAACESGRPGMRCSISRLFGGLQYQVVEALEIRDLRVVYVPARGLGNFGGEEDNWHWPRHTGDWSFFRAYVGKDGLPADQLTKDGALADNVPYHPKHFLKIAKDGLQNADFVMTMGFPGRTSRLATAAQVHHDVEYELPRSLELGQQRYAVLESHLADGGETAIKAGVAKQRAQNFTAKDQGMLTGLTRGNLLAQKDALDRRIHEWAQAPGREAYLEAIEKLGQIEQAAFRDAPADHARLDVLGGSRLLETAIALTRWAEERGKPDAERKPGYQERDVQAAVAGAHAFAKSYDRTLDRSLFKLVLARAAALPEAERPWLATLLDAKKGAKLDDALIDKTLDGWYGTTTLEDEKQRLDLLSSGTPAALKASKDPFLKAAQRMWTVIKTEEKKADAREGDLLVLVPYYTDAMREVKNGFLAPDANRTLRISYGTVRSFHPDAKDGADLPFTSAAGIVAKATGKSPFDAPEAELEAIKAKTFGPYADAQLGGDLPVDFLSDDDTTNGSSGSPTVNARGELVGLAFDGTLDGVAADVVYDAQTNRSIHADIRYTLWTMDLLDGADRLLTEMGVKPALPATK